MLEQKANSGIVQPTVCVLTGGVNLSKDVATALVQPDVGEPDLLNHSHTEAANAAKSGDVAFVKGTASKAWDVIIGASYKDRGMRRDSHDFFGLALKVPLVQVPPKAMLPPMPTRKTPTAPEKAEHPASASSGAPQPAAAENPPTPVVDSTKDRTTDEGKAPAAAENPPTPVVDLTKDSTTDEGKAAASSDAGKVQQRTATQGLPKKARRRQPAAFLSPLPPNPQRAEEVGNEKTRSSRKRSVSLGTVPLTRARNSWLIIPQGRRHNGNGTMLHHQVLDHGTLSPTT